MLSLLDDVDGTGDVEYFLINPDGETGEPSVVFILTVTGRDNGSDLNGIFSGGPIGDSSLFRFFFFSNFARSSSFLDVLLLL